MLGHNRRCRQAAITTSTSSPCPGLQVWCSLLCYCVSSYLPCCLLPICFTRRPSRNCSLVCSLTHIIYSRQLTCYVPSYFYYNIIIAFICSILCRCAHHCTKPQLVDQLGAAIHLVDQRFWIRIADRNDAALKANDTEASNKLHELADTCM